MRRTPYRACVALTGLVLMAMWWPASATAGYEHFMSNQGLSAGNAYASASAHSGVNGIWGYADHTHCPSYATGYSGYTSTPFTGGHFTAQGPCGPGYQGFYPTGLGSVYVRGAEFNPNQSTFDNFSSATYTW